MSVSESPMKFTEGMAVKRKSGLAGDVNSIWVGKCQQLGLDPKGVFHISSVFSSGFRVREIESTVLWAPYRFDIAPPPDKTLEDYM